MFLLEVTWWAHRTLWHLMFSGRDGAPPGPAVRVHRAGHGLAARRADPPRLLPRAAPRGGGAAGSQEAKFGGSTADLSLKPSEYWARQCQLGSSFIRRPEVELRHRSGSTDHVGQRLPPPRGLLAVLPRPSPPRLRRRRRGRGARHGRLATRPASTASTSTHSPRSPPRSARRRPRWRHRSRPTTSRTTRCAAPPSPPPASSVNECVDEGPRRSGRGRHRRRRRHRPGTRRAVRRGGMKVVLADLVPGTARRGGRRACAPTAPRSPVWSPTSPTSRRSSTSRDEAYATYGAVHVLCNNAGVGAGAEGKIWDHTLNDWEWGLSVNLWGVIHGIKAFVPRHARRRRRRPRDEHVVGQRRHRPADVDGHLRHDEGRRDDGHRGALRPAAERSTAASGSRCSIRARRSCAPACSSRRASVPKVGQRAPRARRRTPPSSRSRPACAPRGSTPTTRRSRRSPRKRSRASETVGSGSCRRASAPTTPSAARADVDARPRQSALHEANPVRERTP